MTILLDTSALVAALMPDHDQHIWARPFFRQPGVILSGHTLAELYAVLTASPQFRLKPAYVAQTVGQLAAQLTIVPLHAELYLSAIGRIAALPLTGGAIYDALIAEAALKAGASQLVTLNPKHFVRLGPDIAELVIAPV
ncbi:PIN domain-containing protein [Deinococcus sp.]|uniref:PIN domain-containing protein n=1 Tax=Deinococcus sp. TaxID=47478 RepID=UPI0025E72271|nr:PIN domain-containing protein [Deinococcus sp.]